MRRNKPAVLAFALVASLSSVCLGDTQSNPYLSVVDRNPFGLKPVPPPAPEAPPPPPAVPLAKVILTGITSVYGPPRAFVEITEQEPGKTPNVKKPIMQQGDREGTIELIAIDVVNNSIRIKNGGIETNVVFEVAKSPVGPAAGSPSALPGAVQPAQPGATASSGAPTIISSGGATPTGRAGTAVSLFGGASPAPVNPGSPNGLYPGLAASAASTYASTYSPGGASINNLGAGISTYGAGANFSRQNRTDPNAAPSAQEVYQRMITQKTQADQAGVMLPPLPPSPHLGTAGSGPPPLPPVPGRR